MIESIGNSLFLRSYLHSINAVPKPTFNEKIKVSVRKIAAVFGLASDVVTEMAQYVNSPPQ